VSMEVKKRILYSTPHMGGQKLKKLARLHARKGTMDSFVADLESRLDRFLLRCNLVPSIFAARHLIGHKHVLVNGRPTNRSGLLLHPMAIVEPRPQSKAIFRRLIRQRLANNTFVFADRDSDRQPADADERTSRDAEPTQSRIDLERLRQGTSLPAGNRLPPLPRATPLSAAERDGHSTSAHRSDLETMLLGLLPALAEGDAASELRARRHQLHLDAPPQGPRGQPGSSEAPTITLSLQEGTVAPGGVAPVAYIDRVKARRLLLALLALKPAPAHLPERVGDGEDEAA